MNPTAVQEAGKNGFPMDHLIGIGGRVARTTRVPQAPAAKGYLSLNFIAVGTDFPVIKDIQKYVIDKGNSQTEKGRVGENFYNRGVMNSISSRKRSATRRSSRGRR